jgi:hypothetical protein
MPDMNAAGVAEAFAAIIANVASGRLTESNSFSFAGPNSAPEQLLVWSIGLRQLGACQTRCEREPK